MKTEYKYIYFIWLKNKPKTSVWHCRNQGSNDLLGEVKWYGPWRQYCFFPEMATVFNNTCLDDVNHFMSQLKRQ